LVSAGFRSDHLIFFELAACFSLDFLGFSRQKREFSMGYERFAARNFSLSSPQIDSIDLLAMTDSRPVDGWQVSILGLDPGRS
jgi:hypothetical protein